MSLTYIGNKYEENANFTERGEKEMERFFSNRKMKSYRADPSVQLICRFKAILIFF